MDNKNRGIGLMSGTSLDGLDLACCEFERDQRTGAWSYTLLAAKTVAYAPVWEERLRHVYSASAEQYMMLHALYGKFIAEQVSAFVAEHGLKPGFIASHGHTVFHRPQLGFSTQLGCGATIAAHTGLSTVCDFRSLDVANGGQGAPLVPAGDKLLFGQYDSCLNIGGIANISFDAKGQGNAFDVCFANMALNYLSQQIGKPFDENGSMAASGTINPALLDRLNTITRHYERQSLGREQFEKDIEELLNQSNDTVLNKLATVAEHAATCIADVLNTQQLRNVLVTGGGAFNKHLITRLQHFYKGEVVIPDSNTIQYKEALVFAFLGHLRLNHQINTLKAVTGAKSDSIGGAVYWNVEF